MAVNNNTNDIKEKTYTFKVGSNSPLEIAIHSYIKNEIVDKGEKASVYLRRLIEEDMRRNCIEVDSSSELGYKINALKLEQQSESNILSNISEEIKKVSDSVSIINNSSADKMTDKIYDKLVNLEFILSKNMNYGNATSQVSQPSNSVNTIDSLVIDKLNIIHESMRNLMLKDSSTNNIEVLQKLETINANISNHSSSVELNKILSELNDIKDAIDAIAINNNASEIRRLNSVVTELKNTIQDQVDIINNLSRTIKSQNRLMDNVLANNQTISVDSMSSTDDSYEDDDIQTKIKASQKSLKEKTGNMLKCDM